MAQKHGFSCIFEIFKVTKKGLKYRVFGVFRKNHMLLGLSSVSKSSLANNTAKNCRTWSKVKVHLPFCNQPSEITLLKNFKSTIWRNHVRIWKNFPKMYTYFELSFEINHPVTKYDNIFVTSLNQTWSRQILQIPSI